MRARGTGVIAMIAISATPTPIQRIHRFCFFDIFLGVGTTTEPLLAAVATGAADGPFCPCVPRTDDARPPRPIAAAVACRAASWTAAEF